MGFFGSKKKKDMDAESGYGLHTDDEDLPVATCVTEVPVGAPPAAPQAKNKQSMAPATMVQLPAATSSTMKEIPSALLTRLPTQMSNCPCCQANSRTRVVTAPNWVTWALCVVLLFVCWPLFWLPLVMTKVCATVYFQMQT